MFNSIKYLENINDFPKVGLMFFENSGENLLRLYLERIFKVKTACNIKSDNYNHLHLFKYDKNDSKVPLSNSNLTKLPNSSVINVIENIQTSWIIASDFPCRQKEDYINDNILISSAIVLVRNPIEVIMSKILHDYVHDRNNNTKELFINQIDQMLEDWKYFYNYWIESPIPIHIIRYEDLINEPFEILVRLVKFLLGIRTIENTKLEFLIGSAINKEAEHYYYAYDLELKDDKNSLINDENIEIIQLNFMKKLKRMLIKLNYEINHNEDEEFNWLNEFNKENLVKSVEFHDNLSNQFLTSNYLSIKLEF